MTTTRARELLELAERVEKATGPDRKLDCELWVAVNGRGQPMATVGRPYYIPERYFCNPSPEIEWIGYDLLLVAEHFTGSIDASVTLYGPNGAPAEVSRDPRVNCARALRALAATEPTEDK